MNCRLKKGIIALVVTVVTVIIGILPSYAEKLLLTMSDFSEKNGVNLKTVSSYREFYFTKPAYWDLTPASHISLRLQHSPQLLPERSSLNVLLNGQVIESIKLTQSNVNPTVIKIPIPKRLMKDHNTLRYTVDQHYTYKCEDPFAPELWTTILPETQLLMDYKLTEVVPDLALYPYPIFDELEYKTTALNILMPEGSIVSNETLTSIARISTDISQKVAWRGLTPKVFTSDTIDNSRSYILVGTAKEIPYLSQLSGQLPLKMSGDQFMDPDGGEIPDDSGVLMVIKNPRNVSTNILIATGNSPKGVLNAATALTQKPTVNILNGNYAIIKSVSETPKAGFRDWPEFMRTNEAELYELGFKTETVRSVTSPPIRYILKIMPDIFLPKSKEAFADMEIFYGYSANLDADQSKLELIVDGKSIHSVALSNTSGENYKSLMVKIPVEVLSTYNKVEFKFHLYPLKYDLCRFTTDEHIWGTVYETTRLKLPGEKKVIVPDIGLLNDGGYPFTIYQDLQDVAFVLPDNPNINDIYTLVNISSRLGRMSNSSTGMNVEAITSSDPNEAKKINKHLVVIGTEDRDTLVKKLNAQLHVVYGSDKFKILRIEKEPLAEIKDVPGLGLVEAMLSPWNSKKTILIVYGKTDNELQVSNTVFADDTLFNQIQRGNVLTVKDNVIKGFTTISRENAKIFSHEEGRVTTNDMDWIRIGQYLLMIIGGIALLRLILGYIFDR